MVVLNAGAQLSLCDLGSLPGVDSRWFISFFLFSEEVMWTRGARACKNWKKKNPSELISVFTMLSPIAGSGHFIGFHERKKDWIKAKCSSVHIIHLTWSKFKLNDNVTENWHSALIFLKQTNKQTNKKQTNNKQKDTFVTSKFLCLKVTGALNWL